MQVQDPAGQHSTAQRNSALRAHAGSGQQVATQLPPALLLTPSLSMQIRTAPDCLPGERTIHTCDGLCHQRTRISTFRAAGPGAWTDPVHPDKQRGKDVC